MVSCANTVANKIERQQSATVNVPPGESAGGRAYEHRHIECHRSGLTTGFYSGAHNPQGADAVSSTLHKVITAKMDCIAEVEGERAGGREYWWGCVEACLSGFVTGLQYGAVNPLLAKYTYSKVAQIDHPRAADHDFKELGIRMLIKQTATVTVHLLLTARS